MYIGVTLSKVLDIPEPELIELVNQVVNIINQQSY